MGEEYTGIKVVQKKKNHVYYTSLKFFQYKSVLTLLSFCFLFEVGFPVNKNLYNILDLEH